MGEKPIGGIRRMKIIKIAIVANQEAKTLGLLPKLKKLLKENQLEIDDHHPDIVISVGGDGTLLSAFHRFSHQLETVRFMGIHTGHLGFYTDWRDYELEEMIEALNHLKDEKNLTGIPYPLLDVFIEYGNVERENSPSHFLALNESVIRRIGKTMVADVFIDNELFERFRGDGLALSTPTGSTAYNKSIGGAVLQPTISAMQLAEVASINNIVFKTLGSPLVIAADSFVTIKPRKAQDYYLTVDALEINQKDVKSVTYQIAKEKIRFVPTRHLPFFTRVKDAFIGEI